MPRAQRDRDHSDLTKFRNRLWQQMEKKDLSTARQLATELYRTGLVSVKSKEDSFESPEKIESNAIGSVTSKIQRHLNADTTDDLQGEFVLAYCSFFGCSADYLFGMTSIQTGDLEIRRICERTGLSEPAVTHLVDNALNAYNQPSVVAKCWSQILGSDLFMTLSFDWADVYDECKNVWELQAMAQATEDLGDQMSDTPFQYQMELAKVSTYRIAERQHRAAYDGVLHRLETHITTILNELTESTLNDEKIRERAYTHFQHEVLQRIAVASGHEPPEKPEGDNEFKWNKHILI